MTTMVEYRDIDADESEIRATEDDSVKRTAGYTALFNVWSLDLGGFREQIRPGAFDKTVRSRNDIKALINHDASKVIGSTRAGTLRLTIDERGLWNEKDLPDTTYANDHYVVVKRRDVRGQSFGFSVPQGGDEWNSDWTERHVLEVRLHETSDVTFPAYPQSSVSARSLAMFEARSGRSRDDLAAAIDALRSGSLTDELADVLTEAIQRSRGVSDEDAADTIRAIEEVEQDATRAAEAEVDELFVRRARLALRERAVSLL